MKKSLILIVGLLSMAFAGTAMAATLFAVQNGATDTFIVDQTGVVNTGLPTQIGGSLGVGAAPVNPFDVQKEWGSALSTNILSVFTSINDQPRLTFRRANGTAAIPTALNNGDSLGNLNFRGYDGTSWSTAGVGAVTVNAEEAFTPTTQGTRLVFMTQTKGAAAGASERLRVNSNGNVIIANGGGVAAQAALTTAAVDNLMHIPVAAGALNCANVLTVNAGHAPFWIDSSGGGKVCTCLSATLKCATLL
jgi:hypothetical protein